MKPRAFFLSAAPFRHKPSSRHGTHGTHVHQLPTGPPALKPSTADWPACCARCRAGGGRPGAPAHPHHRGPPRQQTSASHQPLTGLPAVHATELVEGDPGPLRVPIIVVLPDNKLRFGWELRCNGEDAPDLERCGSDSIKDSALDEAESRDGDDQLSAASGSGGSGSSVPRTRSEFPARLLCRCFCFCMRPGGREAACEASHGVGGHKLRSLPAAAVRCIGRRVSCSVLLPGDQAGRVVLRVALASHGS